MSNNSQCSLSHVPHFNLLGKDWLDAAEAAHYCCVSEDHFRRHAASYGLYPRNFMGKQVYEKAELYRAIYQSQQWQKSSSSGATVLPTFPRRAESGVGLNPSVEEALMRLRQFPERRARKKSKST